MFIASPQTKEFFQYAETNIPLFLLNLNFAIFFGSGTVPFLDQYIQRAFQLWSYVHGLSFLLIDGKIAEMDMDFDLDGMLRLTGRQVMVVGS